MWEFKQNRKEPERWFGPSICYIGAGFLSFVLVGHWEEKEGDVLFSFSLSSKARGDKWNFKWLNNKNNELAEIMEEVSLLPASFLTLSLTALVFYLFGFFALQT